MSMQIEMVSCTFLILILHYHFCNYIGLICFSVTENLFPVADATTFFTDLHRILRVISTGNMRTLCHQRLALLEQVYL